MEMYGKIRCVTFAELVGSGIMSLPNYKKHIRERRINVLQKGGNGRMALIDYSSLPERIKRAYDEAHPDAVAELEGRRRENVLRTDAEAIEYFRKYRTEDGAALKDTKQKEYVLNAQVLNAMIEAEAETRAMHAKSGHTRKAELWRITREACEDLRELYGHTLPKNESRLKEKLKAYKEGGYAVLVSQKTGNQSARKIGEGEARLLLKLRRSKMPVLTGMELFNEYNRQAELRGLKTIKSPQTMENYLNDPAVIPLWYGAVHGMQAWKSKFATQLRTTLPTMRDSLWYSDGTKLNLYYRDEQGRMCTTMVYEVMDAYSEMFLGYDIAPGETFESQYRAFRMAVETAGHRPYEIVNDNQGGHKKLSAQGFFKKLCAVHRPTMPYNGQSKTIENAFGRFQQQVLRRLWNFTGMNITAKGAESRPNLEHIMENAYKLPTLEQLKDIYAKCREEWNRRPHPTTGVAREEMYRMSENPETPAVTETDLMQMFWLTSAKAVTYTNQGIAWTLGGETREYDVYGPDGLRDQSWAMKNTGRKFRIVYDPLELTRIELWEELKDGLRYSATATPRVVIARGTQERTEEQTQYMRHVIEENKRMMGYLQMTTEEFDLEEQIAAELFGMSTPRPKNVSKKEMERFEKELDEGARTPFELPKKPAEQQEDGLVPELGRWEKELSNADFSEEDVLGRF